MNPSGPERDRGSPAIEDPGASRRRDGSLERVGVLIPVYDDPVGLDRSLRSLGLEEPGFEVFVVDDGSQRPVHLSEPYHFPIRVIRLPENRGITAALNRGLGVIADRGLEYVARLDAGDVSLPGRLRAQVEFLDSNHDHALVGTHAELVDECGRGLFLWRPPVEHAEVTRQMKYQNCFLHPTVMLRLAHVMQLGGYDPDPRYRYAEDYELFCRIISKYKAANLPSIFLAYVVHDRQITAVCGRASRIGRLRAQLQYFDAGSIHSMLGIARSAVALLLPARAGWRLRQIQSLRARAHRVI